MPLIRPRRLAPGQTVGLVAPSAAPNEPDRIRFAAETIESLGFRVRTGKHVHEREGYLAGADSARADDLNAMFADDSIDAIWCVRGGYGASRLLPALDYDLIRRKPKALIGFTGARIIQQTVRETLPEGFQRAEFLLDHGALDMIVDRRDMRDRIAGLLTMFMHKPAVAAG